VTTDIEERQHLNTAVSALMELVNELYAFGDRTRTGAPGRRGDGGSSVGEAERVETIAAVKEAVEALVRMLAPFAPHTAEEIWERLGHVDGLSVSAWPEFDPEAAKEESITVPVQVNGKLRTRLTVPASVTEDGLREAALADPVVQAHTAGKSVRKVVVAGGRLVNVVVG
jgi:leucyl-tRNA synthetase